MSSSYHFRRFRDENDRNQAHKYLPKLAAIGIVPEIFELSDAGMKSKLCGPFSDWWREATAMDIDLMYPKVVSIIRTLHEHGICHRDLHDCNLVLDEELYPLMIDFELACDVDTHVRCYDVYGPSKSVSIPPKHLEIGRAFGNGVWWGCEDIDPYVPLGRVFNKCP